MDFLQLADRSVLVTGVANRKSVAWHVAQQLHACQAQVIYSVRSENRRTSLQKLLLKAGHEAPVFVCDVARDDQIAQLTESIQALGRPLQGLVHSVAFASYEHGVRPFHETERHQILQAFDISCYSLMALSRALQPCFAPDASVVTISISTTRMASESYGYMAPIKAALDSSLAFLAKSFSSFSEVRFNAVASGLLKTSASAGIPGYVDAYLYAENVIPRRRALQTEEVANVATFLLSPRSGGINAQSIVVDAGMSINYFDRQVMANYFRGGEPSADAR